MKKGFTLIQIIITVAILVLMTSFFAPSLLSHVERTRASKDLMGMDEVTHSIEVGLSDQQVFDEIITHSIADNVSCYIDTKTEAGSAQSSTKLSSNGSVSGYTFNDDARKADSTPYTIAGNMKGLTITFEPKRENGKSFYELKDGVINKFVNPNGNHLEDLPYLYSKVQTIIGKMIEGTSQTYRNSEFTVFICLPSTGGGAVKNGASVYGQYSGTNLSGTVIYEVAKDRVTSDTVLDNDSTGNASGSNNSNGSNNGIEVAPDDNEGNLGNSNVGGGSNDILFDDEGKRIYDEVIVMVDGSTSINSEWPAMVETILQIGEEFLNDDGVETEMTLMSFGISPNVVASHIDTMATLEVILSRYSGSLLYGRSATNCAGAFDGIVNYINSQGDLLKTACVIYITDGGVTMNNKAVIWKDCVVSNMSQAYANNAMLSELSAIASGKTPSDALLSVFGDDVQTLVDNYVIYKAGGSGASDALSVITELQTETLSNGYTKSKQWAINVFSTVYDWAGLDVEAEYPVYVIEKAILDYEAETNTYIEDAFYYTAIKTSTVMGNQTINKQCAIDAGLTAADVAQQIYLVQYGADGRADWMQKINHDCVAYVSAGNISNLAKTVKEFLEARN